MKKRKVWAVVVLVILLCSWFVFAKCFDITAPSGNMTETKIFFSPLCYVYYGNDQIYGRLWVDDNTKIVYLTRQHEAGFTEYLAPNGEPYTYNNGSRSLVPLPAYPGEEIPEEWCLEIPKVS